MKKKQKRPQTEDHTEFSYEVRKRSDLSKKTAIILFVVTAISFFFLNTRFISFHSISETVIKNWSDYSTGKKVNSEFGNLLTIGNCKQFDPSLLNSTKINRRAGVQRSFTTHIC